jgi:methionyl-tRNA formyltransferase
MSKKIIFFGNERLATGVITTTPTLKALLAADYDIMAVVVNEARDVHSKKTRELEIDSLAKEHSLPVFAPQKVTDIIHILGDYKADIGVLVAFGQIVPQSVIDLFPYGIINIHPSLLPLHRGSTPLESVILAGEPTTGVSIMQLVKAMDAGPIIAQKKVMLRGNETKQALADSLLSLGSSMIVEVLPLIFNGIATYTLQDETRTTIDQRISKQDGIINWNDPAITIERKIRAYAGWPGSRTIIANKEVIVTKAHVCDPTNLTAGTATINKENGTRY